MILKTAYRVIDFSFYLLAFLTPLVFYTKTSELFEFNKMVLTYTLTVVSVSAWVVVMITQKRFVFRRTVLDFPLLLFLLAQYISTLLSIDQRTSLLGYYSRFHGGLLSSISYALLYWCYVSLVDSKKTKGVLYAFLTSAIIVSIYALLQKAGIDKNIWVQDVQSRVFSTLGQPNWLAAWLVALMPITWAFTLISHLKSQNSKPHLQSVLPWLGWSAIFFLTLLFTKSRSGMLGFFFTDIIFWTLSYFVHIRSDVIKVKLFKTFIIYHLAFSILILIIGTPWTNPIFQGKQTVVNQITDDGPALEIGGTDSGEIRKIVWQGAIDVWRANPLFGTGVETFAFAFYQHRPTKLNLTSEWDYLYNKAHNEYLNLAATTGTIGLITYLLLIGFSLFCFLKIIGTKTDPQSISNSSRLIIIGLFSGYISILITNFFGFSVVPVALEFFLFPAMAIALHQTPNDKHQIKTNKTNIIQALLIFFVLLLMVYGLFAIGKYWLADYYYSVGKIQSDNSNYETALNYLGKALVLSPTEPVFWTEYSLISANAALNPKEPSKAMVLAKSAVAYSDTAIALSPNSVNFKKNRANVLILLSSFDASYLTEAVNTLQAAVKLAPTDAKLIYNLAIAQLRTGKINQSAVTLQKTIDLKPNYKEARYAYALILKEQEHTVEAKQELTYILNFIDPTDETVIRELNELQ